MKGRGLIVEASYGKSEMNASIKVTIRSYDIITATLPEDMRLDRELGKPIVVELQSGTNVEAMFEELPWLGNPLEDTILIFVNGEQAALSDELRSGDVLDLITPAAGG